ncbi:MAG: tetratricopeptide repeat-containing sulfotransferase family protein [Planctomycetota bacterium]
MNELSGATLFQQALQAFNANRLGQARSMCEDLLKRNRRDVNALDLLGQVALAWGHYDEAATHLLKCASLRPKEPRPHLVLGQIYSIQGRFREALARYDRALKISPRLPAAVAGRADVLERRGDRDKARAALAPFVSAGSETAEMALVQARLDLRDDRFDDVLSGTQRHLHEGTDGSTRRGLHVLRGKALERRGDYDDAFAEFRVANDSMPSAFQPETWRAATDDLIESFTAARLASLPRAHGDTSRPVFVVGMPRSGSTLVEKILDTHPRAHGIGEWKGMQMVVNSIALRIESSLPYPRCIEDLEQEDVDRLSRDYLEGIPGPGRRAERFVDKYLASYRHLGLINLLFPQARVIHTKREAMDTCLSCYIEPLQPVPHPFASDLGHLGFAYREYERLMEHWRTVLDIPVLHVRYEELVADQERISREMVEFCGLPWDDACLRYYETGRVAHTLSYDQVSRPIYGTSVGRAARFAAQLEPLRAALEPSAGATST